MTADPWDPTEPPREAYSRVTDPGRFRPLHQIALDLFERLGAAYAVARTTDFQLLPGMTPFEHARPPIRLTPALRAAAPVAVAFTTFPSVLVRCGRGLGDSFPSCGCDACRETADGEGERVEAMLADVVAGRFRERITRPLFGDATLAWELGDRDAPAGWRGGASRIARAHARALRGGGPRTLQWQPWPARPRGARGRAPTVNVTSRPAGTQHG